MRKVSCELPQQFQPFSAQFRRQQAKAGDVAARSRQASHKSGTDWIARTGHYDWDRSGCLLRSTNRQRPPCNNHIGIERDKLSSEAAQPIRWIAWSILDHNIASFDIAEVTQSSPKLFETTFQTKEADQHHAIWGARMGSERPRQRGGTKKRDELPSQHRDRLDRTRWIRSDSF